MAAKNPEPRPYAHMRKEMVETVAWYFLGSAAVPIMQRKYTGVRSRQTPNDTPNHIRRSRSPAAVAAIPFKNRKRAIISLGTYLATRSRRSLKVSLGSAACSSPSADITQRTKRDTRGLPLSHKAYLE